VLANGPDQVTPYSLGQVLPPYRVQIVDDHGEPLKDGEIGQLQISGPTIGPGVPRGNMRPARLTPDEWFATGDAARVRDGAVWLHGRIDDIEIVAGANVHPVEVEDLITAIAGVREAAVCAVRRANGVSTLRAYVVADLTDGWHDELTALILWTARKSLTWYKVPEDVKYIDALPRNGTGKILRRVLRGQSEEALNGTA
jgi:fatty acid CoA ligase FadD22